MVDVLAVGIRLYHVSKLRERMELGKTYHADAHVSEADVFGCNGLVNTTSEDDAPARELGQDIGDLDIFREVDSGHCMSLVFRLGSDNLQA